MEVTGLKSMSYWKGHGEAVSASMEVGPPARGRAAVRWGLFRSGWFPGRLGEGPGGRGVCRKRGRLRVPVCSALSTPSACRRHFPLLGVGGWASPTWRTQRRCSEVRRARGSLTAFSEGGGRGGPGGPARERFGWAAGPPERGCGASPPPLPGFGGRHFHFSPSSSRFSF